MGFSWDPWEFPYYAHIYTLNDLDRRNGYILRYFTEIGSFESESQPRQSR